MTAPLLTAQELLIEGICNRLRTTLQKHIGLANAAAALHKACAETLAATALEQDVGVPSATIMAGSDGSMYILIKGIPPHWLTGGVCGAHEPKGG